MDMKMDKGKPVPVILKKKIQETPPLEVNIHRGRVNHGVIREEQVSLDKIVEDSQSNFYITGKTTKIGLNNFLQLIEKHDTTEVENMDVEEVVVSSELITRIATTTVIDEDAEDLKYIDSLAIGILSTSFFLSLFALFTRTTEDIRTFAWILLLVSFAFLSNYTYRGIKSGELKRVARICLKSLSKK